MKKPILILFLLAFALVGKAQQNTVPAGTKDSVFYAVEDMPEFPGGMDRFFQFIAKNIQYPAIAFENHIEGRVYVQFIVQANGRLTNATITRSVSPEIDTEALRVIKLSPNWRPGIQNGRTVAVHFTVPITFSLGIPKIDIGDTTVYQTPEYNAGFPGGKNGFFNYLRNNEKRKGNNGVVQVRFVVEKDGSLTHIFIAQSLSKSADEEAIRLVNKMPKFVPALQNDKNVRSSFSLPIYFPAPQ